MSAASAARAAAAATGRPVFISIVTGSGDAGIPFAVKDNIDVAGVPSTAGYPVLSQPATTSATVVTRLEAAGYTPVAKTNMDQFATGLVGTRSPYGACSSALDPSRISGGSSSGSAVAVARGIVPLALGTDTAGSGRVPAAFNGVVGFKPTRGLFPSGGVFPACPSLDCVTTFTPDVDGARAAFAALAGHDPGDPWSRPEPACLPAGVVTRFETVGIPAGSIDLDEEYRGAWSRSLERARALGLRVVPVDIAPFLTAAALLYEGPWVAERYASFGRYLEADGPHLDPVVRGIVLQGRDLKAADAFTAFSRLAELRRRTATVWERIDSLLLPVAPTHPTHAEVAAAPVTLNSRLGTFTNFVNLLDLCAIAVPGADTRTGSPFGVQFISPAFADRPLLDLASQWTGEAPDFLPDRDSLSFAPAAPC